MNDASGPPASGEPGAGSGAAAKVLRGALKDAAGVRRGGLVLGAPYKQTKRHGLILLSGGLGRHAHSQVQY